MHRATFLVIFPIAAAIVSVAGSVAGLGGCSSPHVAVPMVQSSPPATQKRDPLEELARLRSRLKDYPPQEPPLVQCVSLDLDASARVAKYAQKFRQQLISGEIPSKPSFSGRYVVFREPVGVQGVVFIADCRTGRVVDTGVLASWWDSSVSSSLLIVNGPREETYGSPRLYVWDGLALREIP